MMQIRMAITGLLTLIGGIALVTPAPVWAVPVLHTTTPASAFSGLLEATGIVTVRTNLGNQSAPFSLSEVVGGPLTGTVQLDWGQPGWNDALAIPVNGVQIAGQNLGVVSTGPITFPAFPRIQVSYTLNLNQITIIGGDFAAPTLPSDGSLPGPGPWTAIGSLSLDTSLDISDQLFVTFLGIPVLNLPDVICCQEMDSLVVPTQVLLERIGGTPGSGTQVSFSPPFSIPLGVNALSVPSPGCERGILGNCLFDLFAIDISFSTATLRNASYFVEATGTTALVPEPGTALLLGTGLAGLAIRRRRLNYIPR